MWISQLQLLRVKKIKAVIHVSTVALKKKFTYRTVLRTYHATQRTDEKASYASGKYTNYALLL